ncbi:MAG: aminopeptidase P family protein, partial [Actinobacteria bacterium]
LERLTMLVLTEGEAVLVVPELEAPRVSPGAFEVRPWRETEDPVAVVASLAGGARSAAIGDETWASFLLRLQDAMPDTVFGTASGLMRALRIRKDDDELTALREAGHAVDRVVAALSAMEFAGKTERHLAREVAAMAEAEGHDPLGFAIVASGPNGASPHHEPTERVIARGDLVVVDFGGRRNGYCSDTTRTFSAGEPTAEQAAAFEVLARAQAAAVEAVRPGIEAQHIDRVARAVIRDAGYGPRFIHRTGHGIGMDVHEHPYLVEGNDEPLEPGMAFSVEPGIYLAGEWGMRIEDIVCVTEDGVERLNRSERILFRV